MSDQLLDPVGLKVAYLNRAGISGIGIVKSYQNGYYVIANEKGYDEVVTDVRLDYCLVNVSNQPKPITPSKSEREINEAAYIAVLKVIIALALFLLFLYFAYLMLVKPAAQS